MQLRFIAPAAASLVVASCDRPRPQLVVFVDTDAPTLEQADLDSGISRDAAIDALRVDAFDAAGDIYDIRTVRVDKTADWPVSFGVAAPEDEAPFVRFRLRLFRSDLAEAGSVAGNGTLIPPPAVTLDRLVDLPSPSDAPVSLSIVMASACRGIPVSFLGQGSTCIADPLEARSAREKDGFAEVDGPPVSAVGSWEGAREVPCAAPGTEERICIPGGFSILGDARAESVGKDFPLTSSSMPLRPVHVSPFWMDRTEFTVGRYRSFVQAKKITKLLPSQQDPTVFIKRYCTWLGNGDGTNDDFPLNCVLWEAAETACEADGGRLPTEAEWEHAARGRGQRRLYPWGDAAATCCAASLGRKSDSNQLSICLGTGPEPAGSHVPSASCADRGDVSRDGVLDLAGSLGELTQDDIEPYDGPCWAKLGIAANPICHNDSGSPSTRGGFWAGGLESAVLAARRGGIRDFSTGFRCVYDSPPPVIPLTTETRSARCLRRPASPPS